MRVLSAISGFVPSLPTLRFARAAQRVQAVLLIAPTAALAIAMLAARRRS